MKAAKPLRVYLLRSSPAWPAAKSDVPVLTVYKVQITTVEGMERKINKHICRWLGIPPSFTVYKIRPATASPVFSGGGGQSSCEGWGRTPCASCALGEEPRHTSRRVARHHLPKGGTDGTMKYSKEIHSTPSTRNSAKPTLLPMDGRWELTTREESSITSKLSRPPLWGQMW